MPKSDYLSRVEGSSADKRATWYLFLTPCYASLFLWVGFYQNLGRGTINLAELAALFLGLVLAGALAVGMHIAPSTLGRETGLPLVAIGSSSFGSSGAWFVAGLLVALVQTVWVGCAASFGAHLLLRAVGADAGPANLFLVLAAIPVAALACVVVLAGRRAVVVVAVVIGLVAIVALPLFAYGVRDGLAMHTVPEASPLAGTLLLIQMVLVFAMTILISAPDLGRQASSSRDVLLGGLSGIAGPIVFAGFLGLLTIAGGRRLDPLSANAGFVGAAEAAYAPLSVAADLILALTCVPAACVIMMLAADSVGVLLPDTKARVRAGAIGAGAVIVAASGLVNDLASVATWTGALLAPIAGVVTADFVRSGWKWAHTRPGWNFAGLAAFGLGSIVGFLPMAYPGLQPAALYSFLTGLLGYLLLANIGLLPQRKRVHRRRTST